MFSLLAFQCEISIEEVEQFICDDKLVFILMIKTNHITSIYNELFFIKLRIPINILAISFDKRFSF